MNHFLTASTVVAALLLSPASEACHKKHHKGHSCDGRHPPPHHHHHKPENSCTIPNNIYRSQPFRFGDEDHIFSVYMLNGFPSFHLSALRDLADVTDDREFFAKPVPPKHRNHHRPPDMNRAFAARPPRPEPPCTGSRISFQWGGESGMSIPSFFKGQVAMDYIGNSIVGYTTFVTDRSTSVPLQITLNPVFLIE